MGSEEVPLQIISRVTGGVERLAKLPTDTIPKIEASKDIQNSNIRIHSMTCMREVLPNTLGIDFEQDTKLNRGRQMRSSININAKQEGN